MLLPTSIAWSYLAASPLRTQAQRENPCTALLLEHTSCLQQDICNHTFRWVSTQTHYYFIRQHAQTRGSWSAFTVKQFSCTRVAEPTNGQATGFNGAPAVVIPRAGKGAACGLYHSTDVGHSEGGPCGPSTQKKRGGGGGLGACVGDEIKSVNACTHPHGDTGGLR